MVRKSVITFAVLAFLVPASWVLAQDAPQPQKTPAKTPAATASAKTAPTPAATKEQNLKAYIALLRKDVRSQKSATMSEVMQLDPDEAAKFWPIYRDYDAELAKVNDLRVANLQEYAQNYNTLTDAKADETIHNSIAFQKQRGELLAKYYERMKQEMGAITAARFVQVEYQLLLLIDLQITSALPVVGS
jgi:hypothetical protein